MPANGRRDLIRRLKVKADFITNVQCCTTLTGRSGVNKNLRLTFTCPCIADIIPN